MVQKKMWWKSFYTLTQVEYRRFKDPTELSRIIEKALLRIPHVNYLVSYPRECTELRVPMYWESLSKVPNMGTSKNLSNYTDVGTALGTHSSMFTEQVLAWVSTTVILLGKILQGTLDLLRSV